jgi:hypothetical protein
VIGRAGSGSANFVAIERARALQRLPLPQESPRPRRSYVVKVASDRNWRCHVRPPPNFRNLAFRGCILRTTLSHATYAIKFPPDHGKPSPLHPANLVCSCEYVPPKLSFPRLFEISQIRWRLVFAGRHQQAIRAHEVVFPANKDLGIVLAAQLLTPLRQYDSGVAH